MMKMKESTKKRVKKFLMKVAFFSSYLGSVMNRDVDSQKALREYYWNRALKESAVRQNFHDYLSVKSRAKVTA
ncbi:MAG: hypothetical protein ACTSU5_03215 [Promethearchaeota archaeon]